MIGLSAGTHSSEIIAFSTPEPVLTPGRAKTTKWVSLISSPCATKFGCWSACAVFGLVVDHTVSSWPGDFVYFIALLFIPLLTFLSLRIATCHHLTSLLDYFRQLAVSCTDFRSAIFQINSLFSSLLPFFITASMMIVFSIVIGNSQCSPCSLQFISKSACGKSGGHLMLKSLYYSKVLFQCA